MDMSAFVRLKPCPDMLRCCKLQVLCLLGCVLCIWTRQPWFHQEQVAGEDWWFQRLQYHLHRCCKLGQSDICSHRWNRECSRP